MSRVRRRNSNKGSGLINSVINHLPVELHLPGYRFAGPGTKLKERLARSERGINSLDELARSHDIAYENSNLLGDRRKADAILEDQAWENFKSGKTGLKEKAASWLVTTAMKAKRKIGGGGCGFKHAINAARKALKGKLDKSNIVKLMETCIAAAKKSISAIKKKKNRMPRIIPIPRSGGMIPLISIFAGLSALGSLTGGISGMVKTIQEWKSNRNAPVHLSEGLYLTPHKDGKYKVEKGAGLYLAPYKGGLLKKNIKKMSKN